MKTTKLLLTGLLSISSLAFSAENNKQEGFYFLGALGSSANTDYNVTDKQSPLVSNEINYWSYRLGAGYWHNIFSGEHVRTTLGAEAAYNYYGDEDFYYLDKDSAHVTFSAVDILGVLAFHVDKHWAFKMKAGVAYEDVAATEKGFDADFSQKEWVPEGALAVSYLATEHVEIESSFSYLMGQVSDLNGMPDITVVWLGLNYYL